MPEIPQEAIGVVAQVIARMYSSEDPGEIQAARAALQAVRGAGFSIVPTAEYEQLLEERAAHQNIGPRLLVKPERDRDLYVGWSPIMEAPDGCWTRAEALAEGIPESRLRRADETGTSGRYPGAGQWDDSGFIAEQLGFLPRARLATYCVAFCDGRQDEAYALLEPFDDDPDDSLKRIAAAIAQVRETRHG